MGFSPSPAVLSLAISASEQITFSQAVDLMATADVPRHDSQVTQRSYVSDTLAVSSQQTAKLIPKSFTRTIFKTLRSTVPIFTVNKGGAPFFNTLVLGEALNSGFRDLASKTLRN